MHHQEGVTRPGQANLLSGAIHSSRRTIRQPAREKSGENERTTIDNDAPTEDALKSRARQSCRTVSQRVVVCSSSPTYYQQTPKLVCIRTEDTHISQTNQTNRAGQRKEGKNGEGRGNKGIREETPWDRAEIRVHEGYRTIAFAPVRPARSTRPAPVWGRKERDRGCW